MTSTAPARKATALLILVAAIAAALGFQPAASTPSTARAPMDRSQGDHGSAFGEAGGAVPDGTTVFDHEIPGVAKLDPDLLGALRRAAADGGVELLVDSGWRSPAYQQRLLQEAISKYGSEEAAARWVATPERSAHVSGHAVDIGPSEAAAWLSGHGAAYGLCQIYGNEPWHFELRPGAAEVGCPPMYADPTQDPRLRGGSEQAVEPATDIALGDVAAAHDEAQ